MGAAMLGFETVRDEMHGDSEAYRRPRPRLAEGRALAPLVSAMMDVSDGLLLDCWRMAGASGVTIALESALIPVADPARRDECCRWGDDYELLFTLPANIGTPVEAARIGLVEEHGPAPLVLDSQAFRSSEGLGYTH